jgi:hypothetical protein
VTHGAAIRSVLAKHWRALTDRFGYALIAANAAALMLASWTPGDYMVRSGVLSGHEEHTVAYVLSGAFMFAVLAGRWAPWQVAASLTAYAGLLEFGQLWVPGRHAGIDDFLFSTAAAIFGVWVGAALQKRIFPAGDESNRA